MDVNKLSKNISLKGLGLCSVLAEIPGDQHITIALLTSLSKSGKSSTRATMRELECEGLIHKIKVRRNDGMPDTSGWKVNKERINEL